METYIVKYSDDSTSKFKSSCEHAAISHAEQMASFKGVEVISIHYRDTDIFIKGE